MGKWILALLPALVAGCDQSGDRTAPEPTQPTIATGPWRAEVEHFGRTLPFNLELKEGPDGLEAFYLNGPERLQVEQVLADRDGGLQLNFPS